MKTELFVGRLILDCIKQSLQDEVSSDALRRISRISNLFTLGIAISFYYDFIIKEAMLNEEIDEEED